jgi:hypothetical protein
MLDPGNTATIWGVPPISPTGFDPVAYALSTPIDAMLATVAATNSAYPESAMSFMLPVQPTNLTKLKNRGAKVMVYHGVSDAIFSVNDTTTWYEGLKAANGGDASDFAKFYRVPGMGHCGMGGASTDQFDMLTALVNWVEKAEAPSSVVATARGVGNAIGSNPDVPASWSQSRTRPVCPYPQVARLKTGATNLEVADSFICQ